MTAFLPYVTYEEIIHEAVRRKKETGISSGFQEIVMQLFEDRKEHHNPPAFPDHTPWSDMLDSDFYQLLKKLPVFDLRDQKPLFSFANNPSISAEAIMPQLLDVYALYYVRDIAEAVHVHNFFEVDYVMSGSGILITQNERKELHENQICVIGPGCKHDLVVTDDSVVLSLMMRRTTFETTFFRLLEQDDLLAEFLRDILYSHRNTAGYLLFKAEYSAEIHGIVKDIFMESQIRDSYSNTCITSRTHILFSSLLRYYADRIEVHDERTAGTNVNPAKLLQYISQNYRTLTLSSMAEEFHYNPSYLSRVIHEYTGRTLTDILTDLRINKARELLLTTDMKVEVIAMMIGYESVDHFSRRFKKEFGSSPTVYRRNKENI